MSPNLAEGLKHLAAFVLMVAPPIAIIVWLMRGASRRHNDAWRAFADARGWTFTPSRGFWTTWRSARIVGDRAGARVVVDALFERAGRGTRLWTRVYAPGRLHDAALLTAFSPPEARVRSHEDATALEWPGFETDPAVLDTACDLVTRR